MQMANFGKMALIFDGKGANSESGQKTSLIGCFNCSNWSNLSRVFRELSTAEKSTLKIAYFCQCPSLWFSNWAKTKFSFKFQPVCMGQMLESSDFEQPATDPSIISIESSTKNLEEPKGLEKTLKMQLFVNALAFGGLILSKLDF